MAELGGSQISSLMETLPGIAQVLRSPVADAIVHMSRAAVRLDEFRPADLEELLSYAERRSLMTSSEAERVRAEVMGAHQKRLDRAAAKASPAPKAKAAKPAARKARVAVAFFLTGVARAEAVGAAPPQVLKSRMAPACSFALWATCWVRSPS